MESCYHLENMLLGEKLMGHVMGNVYPHGRWMQYQLKDTSIAILEQLKVFKPSNDFDFKAVDESHSLVITMRHHSIDQEMDECITDHSSLLKYLRGSHLSHQVLGEIKEVQVDGCCGFILKEDFGLKGQQTSLIVKANQFLIQLSVRFYDYFVNMEEISIKILNSFHFYLPDDPSNVGITDTGVTHDLLQPTKKIKNVYMRKNYKLLEQRFKKHLHPLTKYLA